MFYIKFPTEKFLTNFCVDLTMSELRFSKDSEAEYIYSRDLGAAFFDIINIQLRDIVTRK